MSKSEQSDISQTSSSLINEGEEPIGKTPADSGGSDADSNSDDSVYSDLEREAELEKSDSEDEGLSENSGTDNEESEDEFSDHLEPDEDVDNVKNLPDEYEYDSSDEEDLRNTIGNIPVEWYNDLQHIGYDLKGRKIGKPLSADELDNFLEKMDNPDYWKTVIDDQTGRHVVLTDRQLSIVRQLVNNRYPDAEYNAHEPWVDFFTKDVMIHPITRRPADKKSFIPSLTEREKVGRLVHAIKMGWLKPKRQTDDEPKYYNIWHADDDDNASRRHSFHIAAPKMRLPGHEESYNPPPEYLLTPEEKEKWESQEPEERKVDFIPQKFDSLRHVPAYSSFIKERFERCLDLYLCPRQQKMRVNVAPEDLLPKLPKPRDLQPYPTVEALVYRGHMDVVRSVSVDPSGQYIVSGSDDCSVRVWEVSSGRCLTRVDTGSDSPVTCVAWCPNPQLSVIAAALGDKRVLLITSGVGDKLKCSATEDLLQGVTAGDSTDGSASSDGGGGVARWRQADGKLYDSGVRVVITLAHDVSRVRWHSAGDYFVTVQPNADSKSVIIHHMSKFRSQTPFSKSKGLIQCAMFHPSKPYLFVASQRYVRVYNLIKQQLTKKLLSNCKWISSMDIHPAGDNLIIGSYDCRLSWFDLDLSTKPYQTLRHHKRAIRQVRYHSKYPLFASASDDGTVIVCHGMVYNDLLQNAQIVPVKILRGHAVTSGSELGVTDCCFHPHQPWVFTAGADMTLRLYT